MDAKRERESDRRKKIMSRHNQCKVGTTFFASFTYFDPMYGIVHFNHFRIEYAHRPKHQPRKK